MFKSKNRKNVYPCKPPFYCIKVGCKEVYIIRTCYPDETVRQNCTVDQETDKIHCKTTAMFDKSFQELRQLENKVPPSKPKRESTKITNRHNILTYRKNPSVTFRGNIGEDKSDMKKYFISYSSIIIFA